MRLLPVAASLVLLSSCTALQETLSAVFGTAAAAQCAARPAGYDGPCPYGALPAFFDDFAYTSAAFPAPAADSGSLFGTNAWAIGDGAVQSRGWFRYNRNDLPVPGEVAFETPSVLLFRFREGLRAEDVPRSIVIFSGATMTSGTYHWRVRLSPHWSGQQLRQSTWLFSPEFFYFDDRTPGDERRYNYASELDFENENHFQGERVGGAFRPDYVTRMSVTNHVGEVHGPAVDARLSHAGPVAWHEGRDILARDGPGRPPFAMKAPQSEWSDRWLHLLLVVDDAAQTVTYRMLPADPRPGDPMAPVAARTVTMGEAFYPRFPMAAAFSLHWPEAEGRLDGTVTLEADWAYHTPVVGLSVEEVLQQVELLREQEIHRANTTGAPLFEPRGEPEQLAVRIEGPERAACGQPAEWTVRLWPGGGRYVTTYRYRVLDGEGRPGAWTTVYAPHLTLTPVPGQTGLELEAATQDLWAPHGTRTLENGWTAPHPDNHAASAQRTVGFDCGG